MRHDHLTLSLALCALSKEYSVNSSDGGDGIFRLLDQYHAR